MLHSGQWKRIFWLVQTIVHILFQTVLPGKAFCLSSANVFLNESFIPAIGERFFSLMETVTLLSSFFLLAETVTAMSGNRTFKNRTYSCWWKRPSGQWQPLSSIVSYISKKSFIPISESAFFSPKEQYCVLFRAFFPTSENHFLNYRKSYLEPLLKPLDIPVNGSSFST